MRWILSWSALAVLCCATAFGQVAEPRPLVQVGAQILTTKDLDRVKQLLPFERFKTALGKTRLIDAIYVEYMIAKAKLEQSGMVKVTADEIARHAAQLVEAGAGEDIKKLGYTLDGFAERELITRNYLLLSSNRLLSNIWGGFLETYSKPVADDQEYIAASRERALTARFSSNPLFNPLYVTLRSMLFEDRKDADAIAPRIRSERDFDALARRYSVVRRDVGGSYTSEFLPSQVAVPELEPEVQIAVMNATKTGLLRVAAPFDRVWLVWLSKRPSRTIDLNSSLDFAVAANLTEASYSGFLKFATNSEVLSIKWLDQSIAPQDPVVAQVRQDNLRLSEIFVERILAEADTTKLASSEFFDYAPQSTFGQYVSYWTERTASVEGLPYAGAGAEYGLLGYVAARVKVSEVQLKNYYWQDRRKYMYRADQRSVQCTFANSQYASKWRDVVIFAPFSIWGNEITNQLDFHCDIEGATNPLPLPRASKTALTPIAGGYITAVSRFQQSFYFVALYGFHPDPLIKPFALVRDQVERAYRTLVAEKQLGNFRAALYARTGTQNRLAEVIKQLEQP